MLTVYLVCAGFGGAILLVQLLLSLVGIGLDADLDFDDGGDAAAPTVHEVSQHDMAALLFRIVSFRNIIAGCTFFGLGGLAGLSGGAGPGLSLLIAVIFGILAVVGVYYLYKSINLFRSDGNLTAKSLQWAPGSVYLTIPGDGKGRGRVQVNHQERTMEYEAITYGDELTVGMPIVVTKVVSEQLVEVKRSE